MAALLAGSGLLGGRASSQLSTPQASTSGRSAGIAHVSRRSAQARHHLARQLAPGDSATVRALSCVARAAKAGSDGQGELQLRPEDAIALQSFLEYQAQRQGDDKPTGPGDVYLIGTGPGDPGLLTMRAVQLMQTADVVLYDRLVSDDILRLIHPGARMVYVGKTAGFHTRSQPEIHQLLLAFAEAGARVVRLKGGDPFVFGRGGEEAAYLWSHGIRVHTVPGITAAAGICAELGIPMTHRGVATSCRYLTGHSREGGEEALDEAVALAADPATTLMVYMGLGTLGRLTAQLLSAGMPASLPAVAVERGTTSDRRVVYGEAAQLQARAVQAGLKSPTLIILGEVVALSPGWRAWEAAGRPLEWNEASYYPPMELDQAALGVLFANAGSEEGAVAADVGSCPSSKSERQPLEGVQEGGLVGSGSGGL